MPSVVALKTGRHQNQIWRCFALALLAVWAASHLSDQVLGQVSPEEHAKHHPGSSSVSPTTGPSAGMGQGVGASPGGMEGMGDMMKMMGGPTPKKDLYPSLMNIPAFTPDQKIQVAAEANERMKAGTAFLSAGLDKLNQALLADDYAAMQSATEQMRQGLAQFDSGISAHRALTEGKPPRDVGLQWFRSELNLSPRAVADAPVGERGLSTLHLFTMALLIAFAIAMLAMYYFKMRRAAALFGRIEPDPGSPPPGSSPPLGGTPGPSAPQGGKSPPEAKLQDNPLPTAGPLAEQNLAQSSELGKTSPPVSTAKSHAPLTSKWHGRLRVQSIVDEAPSVKTFQLRSLDGGLLPFTFLPGQFLNVAFGIGGARVNRSYSISSSPNERDYVDLTIKREERGAVSRHINDLIQVGDEIETGGPVGTFIFTGTESDSLVLVSAGVGITPMVSIARFLTERSWPGDLYFVYGCRTPADFMFQQALADLAKRNPKLHLVVTMSKPGPEWSGRKGRLSRELFTETVPDLASRRVHVCGPVSMMDTTKAILIDLGVSSTNLKSEQFGAVKPAPAAPGVAAAENAPATGPLVTFSRNHKTRNSRDGQTILELSEELGIGIEFSCRIGTCGICKVKKTAGEVDMAVQDSLDDDDRAAGMILACQAKPRTQVTVEA